MKLAPLSACLALAVCASAQAADVDTRWYLAPSISYNFADGDRRADDDWGLGLALGKAINQHWNIEAALRGESLDRNAGGNYDIKTLGVDALYFYNRDPAFSPYALLGAGVMSTKIPGNSDSGLMANIGLGFLKQINDNMSLRADARYRWDDNATNALNKGSFGDWLVNVGLQVALGDKAAPAPMPAPKPVILDSDGDGVADALDKCPNTPAGAKVNAQGCELDSDADGVVDRLDQCPGTPAGAKVNAQGCELDGDGDGVVDRLDKCPTTPAGRKVNAQGCELDGDGDGVVDALDQCPTTLAGRKVDAKGCELDSDGDGVVDGLDQCPTTPAGRKVNAKGCDLDTDGDGVADYLDKCANTPAGDRVDGNGCSLPKVMNLSGVNFDNDQATLRPDAITILDSAVATLQRYPGMKVEVAGHTDSRSTPAHNLDLSDRRAKAVMDYFVSKGVAADRLTSKGYGQDQPIADNNTAEGRAQNRRVELRILN